MASEIRTEKLHIGGMTCINCQNTIERKLRKTPGVQTASVSYANGTAEITYDADSITLKDVSGILDHLGYRLLETPAQQSGIGRTFGLLAIIAALYLTLTQIGVLNLLSPGQLAESSMSYGMLFVIGLTTSVHCLAMCGGINLSQCLSHSSAAEGRFSALRPAFLYNLGRVASYTAVGFMVGALGSVFTLSNTMQGVLKLAAGIFMLIMGLNMLDIFPWLRRFNPRMPSGLANKVQQKKATSSSPLIVGLLNGFMPCGPLQAMQLYALSTSSAVAGALSMLVFSLGTVPLMFGLGALGSLMSKKFSAKIMLSGAVLVAVLGLSMFSQGLSLTGFSSILATPNSAPVQSPGDATTIEDGVQTLNSTLSRGRYPAITVQAGTPVQWTIAAPQGSINGCNNRMIIPEYQLEHTFNVGDNLIEFTPKKAGTFQYSCWMGMIRGTITVLEAGEQPADQTGSSSAAESIPALSITPADLKPAGYTIPTDTLAVATPIDDYQQVTINMTEKGFSPAVIVLQAGLNTEWLIQNTASGENPLILTVPFYQTQAQLAQGENAVYFAPTEDFAFSDGAQTFYGYVKVVPDITAINSDAIKREVADYQTMIWPPEAFSGASAGASCH